MGGNWAWPFGDSDWSSRHAMGDIEVRDPRLPWVVALVLAALTFVWVLRAPISYAGSDPRGSLLVSLAILETGSPRLDDYAGPADLPSRNLSRHHDRVDYFFPLGAPILALPAVWLADRLGWDLLSLEGEARLHRWLAASSVALVLLLAFALFEALRRSASTRLGSKGRDAPDGTAGSVGPWVGLVLAAGLVWGSGLTSTLGTAFWSNDAAALLDLAALTLLAAWAPYKQELGWRRLAILGGILFMAALSRPTSALLALVCLPYVLRRHGWRDALRLSALLALPGLILAAYSMQTYGQPIPPYYDPRRLSGVSTFGQALLGNLISPGRGLSIFSPWLVLVLAGAIRYRRRLAGQPIFWLTVVWSLLHLMVISDYPHWWDGHSFGSRPFVEALPALLVIGYLVVEAALAEWDGSRNEGDGTASSRVAGFAMAGVAVICMTFSIWVHAWQGLYNLNTVRWNGGDWGPELGNVNVDARPEILWDWRHPQALASEAMIRDRYRRLQLAELPLLEPGSAILADGDERFFVEGDWHAVERAGDVVWRWSEGPEPGLVFRVPARWVTRGGGASAQDLHLELVTGTQQGRSFEVLLNRQTLGIVRPEGHFDAGTWSFDAVEESLREANEVRFRLLEAEPVGGGDGRVLGLAFRELRLVLCQGDACG